MIAELIFKRPKAAGAVALAMMIPTAVALCFLETSSLDVFRDETHETMQTLRAIEKKFVNDDLLIVAYRADDVFSYESLLGAQHAVEVLAALELPLEDGRMVPIAADILGLTSVKDAFGENETFRMRALVPHTVPKDSAARELIRARAHNNVIIRENLLAHDDGTASIVVRINPELGDKRYTPIVKATRAALETAGEKTGIHFHLTGHAVTEAEFQAYALSDLMKFNPAVLLIALILAFIFTRSWWAVLAMLDVLGATQLVALGVIPLLGYELNPLGTMIGPISIILAASTMFHFLGEAGNVFDSQRRHVKDVRLQIFADTLYPSFLCSLFTAIGFAALSLSDVQAIREFGIAATVVTATTFVLTVIGVAIHWMWKPPYLFVRTGGLAMSDGFRGLLTSLSRFVVARPHAVLAGGVAIVVACAIGMPRLRMNENSLLYYPEGSPVRVADTLVEEEIAGTETYVVSIRTEETGRMIRPEELQKLEQLARWLEEEADAEVTISIADYLSLMNRAFFDEAPEAYRIPETQEQAAQLLALASDDRLREYIDGDRRWARLFVRSNVHDTSALEMIFQRIEGRLSLTHPASSGYEAKVAGMSRVFAVTSDRVARTQVTSIAASCFLIVGLIIILFRSFSVGLASIYPNVLPLFIVLGWLGWTDTPITVGTAMVSSITFGIAVEDTIHFIEEYRDCLRRGLDPKSAIERALAVKGPSMIWTSVVLALGFFAVALADFVPVAEFGKLLALAVSTSLLGNLIMLPASVLVFKSRLGIKQRGEHTEPEIAVLPRAVSTALILLCCTLGQVARATEDPLALMRASDQRHRVAEQLDDVKLILKDVDGSEKVQQGRMARLQDPADRQGDRMWFHFTGPSDVRGLTLLSVENPASGDDQWLYLPAFKKVRRLGASELGDRFAETDFFYEDLKRRVVDNYSYELLGNERLSGEEFYVLSAKPTDPKTREDSPYGKSKVWLRKSDLFVAKVQHFDRAMKPYKELRFEQPVEVGKGAVRADRIVVTDMQKKHQSVIVVEKRTVGGSVPSRWFDAGSFYQ